MKSFKLIFMVRFINILEQIWLIDTQRVRGAKAT